MICRKCGNYLPDDAKFCEKCGSATVKNTPPVIVREARKSKAGSVLIVIIIFIAFVLGVGYVQNANSAYIAVYAKSTHIIQTVDVIVYVDGEVCFTYNDLAPGDTCYNTEWYEVSWPLYESAVVVQVKTVSTGGGLGTEVHTTDVILKNGDYKKVNIQC